MENLTDFHKTVETGVDLRPYSVENMSRQAYLQDGINVFTIELLVKLMLSSSSPLVTSSDVLLKDNFV